LGKRKNKEKKRAEGGKRKKKVCRGNRDGGSGVSKSTPEWSAIIREKARRSKNIQKTRKESAVEGDRGQKTRQKPTTVAPGGNKVIAYREMGESLKEWTTEGLWLAKTY